MLAQLGRHVQALVLKLVVERPDAEVLQGLGWEWLPCRKRPWDERALGTAAFLLPGGLCQQDAGAEERGGLPAGRGPLRGREERLGSGWTEQGKGETSRHRRWLQGGPPQRGCDGPGPAASACARLDVTPDSGDGRCPLALLRVGLPVPATPPAA